MEALYALLIACAADLWKMLPTHKSKRFHEFHTKLDGVRWADMNPMNLTRVGQTPSTGPRYHHESVVKGCSWMTEDNLCVFHFEGNRSKVIHNKYHGWYEANPWGHITVVVTNDLKLKTSYMKTPPPYPLDFHIKYNGYKEITQTEIDAEIAEVMTVINEWFLTVLRKAFQIRIKEMKEELLAAVWHPKRMAHLLDTYGWEGVEAM